MTAFALSNYVEAGLWISMGVVIAVLGKGRGMTGRMVWITAVTLLIFGISDIVEASTGAWWRPWWLLVWKGLCVVVLLGVVIRTVRVDREKRYAAAHERRKADG